MRERSKIKALFLALLVIFISTTHYSTVLKLSVKLPAEETQGIWFTSKIPVNISFLQSKTTSQECSGWLTEIRIPGFFATNKYLIEPPLLKLIRKIFVIDVFSYTSCKSVILFPFHEFS